MSFSNRAFSGSGSGHAGDGEAGREKEGSTGPRKDPQEEVWREQVERTERYSM